MRSYAELRLPSVHSQPEARVWQPSDVSAAAHSQAVRESEKRETNENDVRPGRHSRQPLSLQEQNLQQARRFMETGGFDRFSRHST